MPDIREYFRQSERLTKDFDDILMEDVFNYLKIVLMDEDEFSKKYGRDTGGFFSPNINGKNEIFVMRNSRNILCHEFIHFIKYKIENKYGINRCVDWINEPLTEHVSKGVCGNIYGYYPVAFFTEWLLLQYPGLTLDDFFYDNVDICK